jgi:hypothetical protein
MTKLKQKPTINKSSKRVEGKELSATGVKKIQKKKLANKWNDSEYSSLISLVRQHGEDWNKIASRLPNKTPKQCMQKFKNSQRSAKKGNWTEEEDFLLLRWVKENGATKWTECSKQIKGRCGKQCRERWVNILNPDVKKGNWSDHEQDVIFQNLSTFMTSWSSMSRILPGRTENSIKNYFYSSVRRLKSNPIAHVLKDIYVRKKTHISQINDSNAFINDELAKLNHLSQKICRYLFDKNRKEDPFKTFLLSVLFSNDPSGNIPAQNIEFNETELPTKIVNQITTKEQGVAVHDQRSITEIDKENRLSSSDDANAVLEVIRKLSENANLSNYVPLLKYLETQLHNSQIIRNDKNVQIRLPSCWNCKNEVCNLHPQNSKHQI